MFYERISFPRASGTNRCASNTRTKSISSRCPPPRDNLIQSCDARTAPAAASLLSDDDPLSHRSALPCFWGQLGRLCFSGVPSVQHSDLSLRIPYTHRLLSPIVNGLHCMEKKNSPAVNNRGSLCSLIAVNMEISPCTSY